MFSTTTTNCTFHANGNYGCTRGKERFKNPPATQVNKETDYSLLLQFTFSQTTNGKDVFLPGLRFKPGKYKIDSKDGFVAKMLEYNDKEWSSVKLDAIDKNTKKASNALSAKIKVSLTSPKGDEWDIWFAPSAKVARSKSYFPLMINEFKAKQSEYTHVEIVEIPRTLP